MGKGKLAKFAEMETFANVFQYPYSEVKNQLQVGIADVQLAPARHALAGRWHSDYFHNTNPIVLELGCGKGEYTVGLARLHPDQNFIGVDIKGSRMHKGAKEALDAGLKNVAFLRTNIEIIDCFFAPDEVSEIWLTFSDPQMKNPRKRLTSTYFMRRYRRFLVDGGLIHLKTDSLFLYTYTRLMAEKNRLPVFMATDDLYGANPDAPGQPPVVGPSASDLDAQGTDRLVPHSSFAIQTYYESQWIARGLSIKYLGFQLPQQGPLEESEEEIATDDYRSYKRHTRSPKETRK